MADHQLAPIPLRGLEAGEGNGAGAADILLPVQHNEVAEEENIVFELLEARDTDTAWHRLCVRLAQSCKSENGAAHTERLVKITKWTIAASLLLGYIIYLGYCTYLLPTRFWGTPDAEASIRLIWVSLAAAAIAAAYLGPRSCPAAAGAAFTCWQNLYSCYKRLLSPLTTYWWLAEVAVILGFVVWMAVESPKNLVSVGGAVVLLLLSLVISVHPSRVNWQTVLGGIVIQLIFGILILRTASGFVVFTFIGDRIAGFMQHCEEGSKFLFGNKYSEHFFAFSVLPVIVYFSSVMSVLFHLGVLQVVIGKIGWVLERIMGTTAAESIVASANIFVGQTEAPMMIRPFLRHMTNSEIHSVMTSGFATIAGGVLAAYIRMGVPARHLLSASVMSAPAALAISKIVYPETRKSRTRVADLEHLTMTQYAGIVEAVGMGAMASMAVVGAIAVNLIAFVSILAFVNATVTWLGYRAGMGFPLTFEYIMSFLFWPLALVMGVAPRDCRQVAELIGIKTFLNEFVAYERFSTIKQNYKTYTAALGNTTHLDYTWVGTDVVVPSLNLSLPGGLIFEDRSLVIATYSLCGFSNLGSIGIIIGALTVMAPARQSDIVACAPRAMVAGNIACFLTACIAGLFFTDADRVLF